MAFHRPRCRSASILSATAGIPLTSTGTSAAALGCGSSRSATTPWARTCSASGTARPSQSEAARFWLRAASRRSLSRESSRPTKSSAIPPLASASIAVAAAVSRALRSGPPAVRASAMDAHSSAVG